MIFLQNKSEFLCFVLLYELQVLVLNTLYDFVYICFKQ